ncbi:MAG: type II toxin-antitoxin system RelB/DinJ family antitoxin [Oscillospiraceae bacterium]|jgi:DNA-damage-inducible protein J
MANTSVVCARIDSKLKKTAEEILSKLGITPASAIQMFYSEIVRTNGLPLDLQLSCRKPTSVGGMDRSRLNSELEKGYTSIKEGRTYSSDEVDQIMKNEFKV